MKSKMTEREFIERYKLEQPMYAAWGNYLKEYIIDEIGRKYVDLGKILKVPVSCRTKAVDSLVAKAFYRNKNYNNPYDDITDKVGIRFVVMTENQVEFICDIIQNCAGWLSYSKDIDYNVLREAHPEEFDYQSCHYIVKNENEIVCPVHTIVKGTPCEIQVRTLEQHAYAEVSHELFYKKKENCNTGALRLLARTAAFNEQSDELFGRMYKMVDGKEEKYNEFIKSIVNKFGFACESDKLNRLIYDDILPLIEKYNVDIEEIFRYMTNNEYIIDLIKQKRDSLLFNQPVVLVLYYLMQTHQYELCDAWQYPEDMLDSIKSDLGLSID